MAFSGFSTGVLVSTTQGDSTGLTLLPDRVVYTTSTSPLASQCKLNVRLKNGVAGGVIFDQTQAASYGLVDLEMPPGMTWDGVIVTTLTQGSVQIYLR